MEITYLYGSQPTSCWLLYVQNDRRGLGTHRDYKSLWFSDNTCRFVHAQNHMMRAWTHRDLQVSMCPRPHLVVSCACKKPYVRYETYQRLTSLYGSYSPHLLVFACKTTSEGFRTRITSLVLVPDAHQVAILHAQNQQIFSWVQN